MNKRLICEKCGGETETKFVDKTIFHKGKKVLVKNIEAEVCPDCDERYFGSVSNFMMTKKQLRNN